jgi:hypothetical protein
MRTSLLTREASFKHTLINNSAGGYDHQAVYLFTFE